MKIWSLPQFTPHLKHFINITQPKLPRSRIQTKLISRREALGALGALGDLWSLGSLGDLGASGALGSIYYVGQIEGIRGYWILRLEWTIGGGVDKKQRP